MVFYEVLINVQYFVLSEKYDATIGINSCFVLYIFDRMPGM